MLPFLVCIRFLDMLSLSKLQTIIVYPVVLADMYSDDIKKYTEGATGLELELEEMLPGKPPKGYADYLVFLLQKRLHTSSELLVCIPCFMFDFGYLSYF